MNLFKILDSTPEPPIIELDFDRTDNSRVYNLPCPMYEYQKELTDQIISLHYPEILKFCELNDKKDIIIDSLTKCIKNLLLVTTHPYLMIDHYMPKNLSYKEMPNKLAETSGKFNVLRDLLNILIKNPSKKNIGLVISNNNRLFDLTESLLLGCNGSKIVKRYVGNNIQRESKKVKNSNNGNSNTVIHMIPNDGNITKDLPSLDSTKFDVLVVIDGNVDLKGEFFTRTRFQHNPLGSVVINLIPINTIEHIKLFHDDLYKIVSSVVCLRDNIGNLPPDLFPIYQQKLTYFVKFFVNLITLQENPCWPLPLLTKIPNFTPTDVEKSLLTEIQYSYYNPETRDEIVPTYYQLKRLKSDYITNPLINSYGKLSGIESIQDDFKDHLTHKLLINLSTTCYNLKIVQDELNNYNEDRSELIGRRQKEMKQTMSNITDDIEHNETRINSANKMIIKKSQQIEQIRSQILTKKEQMNTYTDKYSMNQKEIWKLQNEIKNYITKIQLKNDERNFTNTELNNCKNSIEESEKEINETIAKIDDCKRKYAELESQQENSYKQHQLKKQKLLDQIEQEELVNKQLKSKFSHTFKFLKDTSHLKKRKGRGITPK